MSYILYCEILVTVKDLEHDVKLAFCNLDEDTLMIDHKTCTIVYALY